VRGVPRESFLFFFLGGCIRCGCVWRADRSMVLRGQVSAATQRGGAACVVTIRAWPKIRVAVQHGRGTAWSGGMCHHVRERPENQAWQCNMGVAVPGWWGRCVSSQMCEWPDHQAWWSNMGAVQLGGCGMCSSRHERPENQGVVGHMGAACVFTILSGFDTQGWWVQMGTVGSVGVWHVLLILVSRPKVWGYTRLLVW